jgi:hypothetical protein
MYGHNDFGRLIPSNGKSVALYTIDFMPAVTERFGTHDSLAAGFLGFCTTMSLAERGFMPAVHGGICHV